MEGDTDDSRLYKTQTGQKTDKSTWSVKISGEKHKKRLFFHSLFNVDSQHKSL